jgi:uncharacterized protein (DUF1015 family)
MVEIRPFRGLRYDLPRAGEASSLLAPPYDVVDEAQREQLAGSSPHNCIRLILPEGDGDERYRNAAAELHRMMGEALVRDDAPSYYVYHQQFEAEGRSYVRKGFVALIELTSFGDGPVKPHERTLAGPKEDRLKLMRACDAHLELVFGLFPDPKREWERPLEERLGDPVLEADFGGTKHLLFRVSDPKVTEGLGAALRDKPVYIADGHHRYETMCSYRRELEEKGRGEEARFGMIFLSNLDDPGLVVLPTHRIVHSVGAVDMDAVLGELSQFFDHQQLALPADGPSLRKLLMSASAEADGRAAFGLCVPGRGVLHQLVLARDFDPARAGVDALPEALRELDVVLLHELVLERALGIDKQAQAAKANLYYYKSTEAALDLARRADGGDAKAELVCFMNATTVHQVVEVCDSGEVMPQKSTFFYPKIPTGLVFHTLEDPEGASSS